MPFLIIIILAVIQGLTEFLPVSSSGHLVIAQHYLPWFTSTPLPFDVLLHLGTLISLVIYFYKDIWKIVSSFFSWHAPEAGEWRRLGLLIIIGSIPAGIVGVLFKDRIEGLFENARIIPFMFLVTAALLLIAERRATANKNARPIGSMGIKEALIIGLFQAVAITPGISRSGSTIAGGLLTGIEKEAAARFSFLLAIPAVLGAFILSVGDLAAFDIRYVVGVAVSCLVGLAAIWLTFRFVVNKKLWIFSVYLVILGVFLIIINSL